MMGINLAWKVERYTTIGLSLGEPSQVEPRTVDLTHLREGEAPEEMDLGLKFS